MAPGFDFKSILSPRNRKSSKLECNFDDSSRAACNSQSPRFSFFLNEVRDNLSRLSAHHCKDNLVGESIPQLQDPKTWGLENEDKVIRRQRSHLEMYKNGSTQPSPRHSNLQSPQSQSKHTSSPINAPGRIFDGQISPKLPSPNLQNFKHSKFPGLDSSDATSQPCSPTSLKLINPWRTTEFGAPGTEYYRMLHKDFDGREISAWHEVPLYQSYEGYSSPTITFICTTPAGSWAEYMPVGCEPSTPLALTVRNGRPSHFSSNSPWNVGIIPQTYADPELKNENYGGLRYKEGPLVVVDISRRGAWTGDIYCVKPLAAFALVDEECKLSWIIVAVDASHELAQVELSTKFMESKLGNVLREVREWFRTCHCFNAGDPKTVFGLNERAVGPLTVSRLVADCHSSWQHLTHHNPPESAANLPLIRPTDSSAYESYWLMYHYPDFMSSVTIELCDPSMKVVEPQMSQGKSPQTSFGSTSSKASSHSVWSSGSSEEVVRGLDLSMRNITGKQEKGFSDENIAQGKVSCETRERIMATPPLSPARSPARSLRDGNRKTRLKTRSKVSPTTGMSPRSKGNRTTQSPRRRYSVSPHYVEDVSFSFPVLPPPSIHRSDLDCAKTVEQKRALLADGRPSQAVGGTNYLRDSDDDRSQIVAKIRQSIANCQRWDVAIEKKATGSIVHHSQHDSRGKLASEPFGNAVHSPRGNHLSELPPTFNKIAYQIDETEQLHAKFNSRLAHTKALLGRLRKHADSSESSEV